jgi:hypothetical protein
MGACGWLLTGVAATVRLHLNSFDSRATMYSPHAHSRGLEDRSRANGGK